MAFKQVVAGVMAAVIWIRHSDRLLHRTDFGLNPQRKQEAQTTANIVARKRAQMVRSGDAQTDLEPSERTKTRVDTPGVRKCLSEKDLRSIQKKAMRETTKSEDVLQNLRHEKGKATRS